MSNENNKVSVAEERAKAILDSITDGILALDLKGNITAINERARQMTGYRIEDYLGKNIAELEMLAPESLRAIVENFPKRMRGVSIPPYEIEVTARDGTRLFLELSATPLRERGEIIGELVIARDITEKKRAEIELRETKEDVERKVEQRTAELRQTMEDLARSEERYQAIFEYAPDAVVVYDTNDVVQLWNKQAERIFGYKAEEIIGRTYHILVPHDLREEASRLHSEVEEKGYFRKYETERIRKDGTRFPVELTRATLRDERGNIIGVSAIVRDISERKRLEQELIRAERLAAIGQLASSVAHELRQPLTVLTNSAYFLKMKLKDGDEKVKKHLDIMEREVGLAEGIISNILDFARPKQPIMEQVDINAIIERTLSRVPLPSSIELVLNLEPGLPAVRAAPEQMGQVFSNIILNATQAMPDGGRLTISTQSNEEWIRAEVQDNGIGIATKDLAHIFGPLFTQKDKGIGLGLTIAKSIVEAHQGKIEVQSKTGQGTRVSIDLPTRRGDE